MLNTAGTSEFSAMAEVGAPPLVPDQPIDRTHLFKMTLGDHSLEGEVLRLFERQVAMLLGRMDATDPITRSYLGELERVEAEAAKRP